MRTGVAYMGHHNPRHLREDVEDIKGLGCDDVLVALQENDFAHFTGKVRFTPGIAKELGLRPIAIFWGALNLFGGGRSSQFLLGHPDGSQVNADGSPRPEGCYVNPACVGRIREMIDAIAEAGYEGYFVDEPTWLVDCYCPSCRARFEEWNGCDLASATNERKDEFRERCTLDYVRTIADYCKANHPQLETMCCLMECDRRMWRAAAGIASLDNLGTDIYWVNDDRDVEEMTPMVRDLAGVCSHAGKLHHEWLQAWIVKKGNEPRIGEQGDVLIRGQPDALYVWAYEAQVGTVESSEDAAAAWEAAKAVLRRAKEAVPCVQ